MIEHKEKGTAVLTVINILGVCINFEGFYM